MVRDLDLDLTVRSIPTVRDPDGLALSSRNARLSDAERAAALALPRALATRDPAAARAALDGLDVDYVEVADFDPPVLAAAVRVGSTRLIDNVVLDRGGTMTTRPRKPAPGTPAPGKLALTELAELKARRQPIAMVTAYDAPSGRLADAAGADVILVGDSAAMTVLGHDSTVPATMDEMIVLTRATNRGARRPLVVADMPFGSFQVSDEEALQQRDPLRQGGGRRRGQARGCRADALARADDRRRRHPGDGPHRADAAVGDDARRLQGAGPDGREGGAALRGRARARGCRLLRDRARGRAGAGCGADHRGADRADDRDRRGRRTATGRSSSGTTCSACTRATPRASSSSTRTSQR